jgi:putative ABC transport system permease protein
MGFSSNLSMFGSTTVFDMFKSLSSSKAWKSWSPLVLLVILLAAIVLAIYWFLGTRLGLSIRATGDSPAMVRASSINPAFTTIVGLCVANALTGMAGCLIGQYNGNSDINLGTGMVTVALASLIIGEMFFKNGSMLMRIIGVVIGSVLYRFVMSVALRLNIPTEAFKLVSALIVAAALTTPQIRKLIALHAQKRASMKMSLEDEEEGGDR